MGRNLMGYLYAVALLVIAGAGLSLALFVVGFVIVMLLAGVAAATVNP